MKICVVAEGPDELGDVDDPKSPSALVYLIRRLLDLSADFPVDRKSFLTKYRVHPDVANKGGKYVRKAKRFAIKAGEDRYDVLMLVLDRDRNASRQRAVVKGLEDLRSETASAHKCSTVVGFAIETFEAWMMADEQALSEVLESQIAPVTKPEELDGEPGTEQHPKAVMRKHLKKSPAAYKRLWQFYPLVAEKADLAKLEKRCPKGFGRFAKDVRRLRNAVDAPGRE